MSEDLAEEMDKSRNLLNAYSQANELLLSVGAMTSVVAMDNEMRKEHKRMRAIGNESPEVLSAMAWSRAV